MVFSVLLSVYVVQILLVQAAAGPVQDCGANFQSLLNQLVTVKKSCDSAAYYDCCQVISKYICRNEDFHRYILSQIKTLFPEATTGLYTLGDISRHTQSPFMTSSTVMLTAYCDMDTDGGGWMVIQRRLPNGTVNFTRNWKEYENGFGDLNGEFWYGLKNIHHLTTRDQVELRIDMVRKDNGEKLSWTYQTYQVAGAEAKYELTIGEGEGTGHDAMAIHSCSQFSTYDSDNDASGTNCAYVHQAGWWYKGCYHAHLNGPHIRPTHAGVDRTHAILEWYDGSQYTSMDSAVMKIRVKKCIPATC